MISMWDPGADDLQDPTILQMDKVGTDNGWNRERVK